MPVGFTRIIVSAFDVCSKRCRSCECMMVLHSGSTLIIYFLGGRVSNRDAVKFKVEIFHVANVRGLLWLVLSSLSKRLGPF